MGICSGKKHKVEEAPPFKDNSYIEKEVISEVDHDVSEEIIQAPIQETFEVKEEVVNSPVSLINERKEKIVPPLPPVQLETLGQMGPPSDPKPKRGSKAKRSKKLKKITKTQNSPINDQVDNSRYADILKRYPDYEFLRKVGDGSFGEIIEIRKIGNDENDTIKIYA